MKKLFLFVFLAVFLAAVANAGLLSAEESETYYTFGTVISASDEIVTITEVTYDGETDSEIVEEVVYSLTPETEVENSKLISDVVPGSEIDIEYVEKDGKRTAAYIYVYEEEFTD